MSPQSKENNPELSIITINYQTDDLVVNLVQKLVPRLGVEIIIVDNSPTDSLHHKLPKRSDVQYFFTGKNLGFSGGNNYGLSKARGEWLFLLNSDTLVSTEDVLKLLSETKKCKYLVSAPKLIQPDGKIQNNVGYLDSFFKHPLNYLFVRPRFLRCSSVKEPIQVDLLTGSAMLIHNSVFKQIGLLDEKNFFMYYEDIDFSYRLHQKGVSVLYDPDVRILHLGGASSDQDTRQKNKNYQHGLNIYLKKNRGSLALVLNRLFHFIS
ncbi:MAG: WsbD [Candidatus Collierbacteria bacterium GW2011_GWC2_44_18]|uniref:WsbD n=2 Tax=Microgenomates group TaxID=1794810 RepID=A0A0G1J8T8_9BACT|nr:MAG: glycosyl transferase family protein [Microgenomates group bacterium GW2011_GWC1_44_10]KKT49540.1 MAG: WsbD [Candidatus Collierbacteria bacterium GW2011_GWC2_44_18]KKT67778.1 MAG: WsbD [Candidatus Woesebacteria bacterium GW2011_GWA2_44_33]